MGLFDDAAESERIGVWGTVAKPQRWFKPDEPDYDASADGLSSYLVAVAALRERHRMIVKGLLPALIRARYARGLSRNELAALLGVSENTVYLWESGKHFPNQSMLSRWCDLLGVLGDMER